MPNRDDGSLSTIHGYEALREMLERHHLSAAQRRVAQHLLDHLPASVFLSSIELADKVGVSQPTVTRLAASLGFEGFTAFNDVLRRMLFETSTTRRSEHDTRNEFQESLAFDQRSLTLLGESLADPAPLRETCRWLAASTPLTIMGIRASAPIAMYLGYYAATIHSDVRTHVHGGGQLLDALEQARYAGGTWTLAVALPHLPREMLTALRFARECGLRTFVLAESQPPPALVAVADELVTAPVGTRLTFDSHAAPMALAAALLHMITEAQPDTFQRRLEDFDRHVANERMFHGYSNS